MTVVSTPDGGRNASAELHMMGKLQILGRKWPKRMLLLISICKLVYAPCFSLLTVAIPGSGPSHVAGFCVGVEMSRDNRTWKAV